MEPMDDCRATLDFDERRDNAFPASDQAMTKSPSSDVGIDHSGIPGNGAIKKPSNLRTAGRSAKKKSPARTSELPPSQGAAKSSGEKMRRLKSAQALNRAKQRRVEQVFKLSDEVSKLSSQNQLLATKLTSLIQKVGNAVDENKLLRRMLSRISEMPPGVPGVETSGEPAAMAVPSFLKLLPSRPSMECLLVKN